MKITDTVKAYIGTAIRRHMDEQGLTTREVAEKCFMQHTQVVRVTNATTNYTIRTLILILDAVGLEIKIVRKQK